MTGALPDDVLAGLWQAVAHVAQARLAVLEDALLAVREGAVDAPARCATGAEEAHKLVGSLDSYARTGGSGLALQAAQLLEAPAPDVAALARVLADLRATVDEPCPAASGDLAVRGQ